MRDILKKDRELSLSFKKLVLQPRSGQGHIRKWLVENGLFYSPGGSCKRGEIHNGDNNSPYP